MGWAAQYDATYASAKLGDVEGDEQAEMESGGFEIGEHLGHVDGSEGLYGLELHDERAIDEQVDPAFSNGDPLVLYGDGSLATVGNALAVRLDGRFVPLATSDPELLTEFELEAKSSQCLSA